MLFLIGGSFLIGALLARFFKFYSLFPVCVLSIVLVLTNPFQREWSWWGLCVNSGLIVLMLQLGFLFGTAVLVYLPSVRVKAVAPSRPSSLRVKNWP